MDTGAERGIEEKTPQSASQLPLLSIKHTVSGLAWPQEQGVCSSACVLRAYDHKNVALWKPVKGAVNLEEEAAGQHTQKRIGTPTGRRLGSGRRP